MKRALPACLVFALLLAACMVDKPVFAPAPAGWDTVLSETSETVPVGVDWGSSFDLAAPARLEVDWTIEPDRSLTYLLVTDAQYQTAVTTQHDFTTEGADYVRRMEALRGAGSDSTDPLPAGRYMLLIRNTAGTAPAKVTIRVIGQRS